uniref:Endoplasmin n=1 Tax=Arundo donax TaxID=35708 RepID=A0A0A9EIN0_ARUDO
MMTNSMCGSQKLMDRLLSPRIHGTSPLAVELR